MPGCGVLPFGRISAGEIAMNLARYFLLSSGNEWLVTLEGRTIGRYRSRTEATEAAVVMADLMGAMHYDADVIVQAEPGGPLELVWAYGGEGVAKPVGRRAAEAGKPRRHVRLVQRGEAA
jgi:hypothetical protein